MTTLHSRKSIDPSPLRRGFRFGALGRKKCLMYPSTKVLSVRHSFSRSHLRDGFLFFALGVGLFAHRTLKLRLGPRTSLALSCLLPLLWSLIAMSAFAQGPVLDSESARKPMSHLPCLDQTVAFSSGSTWTLCVTA